MITAVTKTRLFNSNVTCVLYAQLWLPNLDSLDNDGDDRFKTIDFHRETFAQNPENPPYLLANYTISNSGWEITGHYASETTDSGDKMD